MRRPGWTASTSAPPTSGSHSAAPPPEDPSVADEFEAALRTIREVAAQVGVAAGVHTVSGEQAAQRLDEGYTFATIASDISHLEQIAASHLDAARR